MAWLLRRRRAAPTPEPEVAPKAVEPRSTGDALEFDSAHLRDDVQRCCSMQIPVVIMVPDRNLIVQGRFAAITDNTVTFELTERPSEELRPLTVCCITLYRNGRAFLFASLVREYTPRLAGRLARVVVRLPDKVVGSDMRESFRVPVMAGTGLTCTLKLGDRTWRPGVVDVSLGGIQLEFGSGPEPELDVGSHVTVDLSLGPDSATLKAEVRRKQDRRIGLFFYEHLHFDEFRSPDAFRRIVVALERHWLATRCD